MKTFLRLLGKMALMLVGLCGLGVILIYSGVYNVAATQGHTKPVARALRLAMVRSVIVQARKVVPPAQFDSRDRILAEHAAHHFEMMCRTCHGAPGKKPDPWKLYPPAPDLADALRVTRWQDREVFWIIKNGIKDTGMSAYGPSHSDEELWALTALVRQLESITSERYRTMVERVPPDERPHNDEHASDPQGSEAEHSHGR